MPPQYTLTFINQSSTAGQAVLYQTAPSGLQSLAWLVRDVDAAGGANATANFGWNLNYGYMSMETGSGNTTGFAQVVPADPQTQNAVTYDLSGNSFGTPTAGTTAGTLTITESSPVAVGFAMDSSPLFGALPPTTTLTFTPAAAPTYQLSFGNFVVGQVMPVSASTTAASSSPPTATVTFPPNIFAMTATLSASNVLTVAPSSPSS